MVSPQPPSSESPWLRRLTSPAAALVVLGVFWIFMLASLKDKSPTYDEIAHVTAGYSYWKFNDYRLNPENGNLPQRLEALPLLSGYSFPSLGTTWHNADEWRLGYEWFYQLGHNAAGMLWRGRAMAGLLAVILGALVWCWSRHLFGATAGMLSLLLFVLNPTVLANGALMTSDLACALFFLASTWSFWRLLQRISFSRLLLSGVLMGALFISKMSALLIVPVIVAMMIIRLAQARPLPLGRRELVGRGPQALVLGGVVLAHVLIVTAVIWSAYGFRYQAGSGAESDFIDPWPTVLGQPDPRVVLDQLDLSPAQVERVMREIQARDVQPVWNESTLAVIRTIQRDILTPAQSRKLEELRAAPPSAPVPRIIAAIARHRLLPEAYAYGYAFAWHGANERPAFFNGHFSTSGWSSFFPYTFLVKTPLPMLVMTLLAVARVTLLLRRRKKSWNDLSPLILLFAIYWIAIVTSRLNIGHRHILVTYPPLFVLCGAVLAAGGPGLRRVVPILACALLAIQGIEIAARFPNYLAYFNGIVTPAKAYRHLVDSSLDWGQDLPGVKRYLDAQPAGRRAYLSYFGHASPEYYHIPATLLFSISGFDWQRSPPLLLEQIPAAQPDQALAQVRRDRPDYDFFALSADDERLPVMLLKKPSALRLEAGTYFISATLLQPVYFGKSGPRGPWNARYEATYQRLAQAVRPLLSDDPGVRAAAIQKRRPEAWRKILTDYDTFRFARLTAFLREREPDDNVNSSILVYRLTDADLSRALAGPPVELSPDVPASAP